MKKVNKINQIVRLKRVMQRWKTMSISKNRSSSDSDSDNPKPAKRGGCIPSGSLAVYVGPERRRFIIPTRFLNLPVFVALLNQAEEEFGFQTSGALALPCDVGFFKRLLRLLCRDEERFGALGLDDIVNVCADMAAAAIDSSKCKDVTNNDSCHSFTPLLAKN